MIALKWGLEHFREIMSDHFGDEACTFLYNYYVKESGQCWGPPEEVQILVDPEMIRQKWIEYKSWDDAMRDHKDHFDYYHIRNGVTLRKK